MIYVAIGLIIIPSFLNYIYMEKKINYINNLMKD